MTRAWAVASLALLCLVGLVGCGKKPEPDDQVAAVVNGQPISSAEVEFVFNQQKIPGESDEGAANRKRAILGDLVRTELLAQYALSKKFDEKDDLLIQEKLARRQILASLAGRNHAQSPPPLTPDAISKVIAANPMAFRDRKLLTLDTMELITPDEGLFERLDKQGEKGATLDRLQELAREAKATAVRGVRSVGTDQLPPVIMKALLEAKPGTPVVVKASKDRGVVLVLRNTVPAPVPDEVAQRIVTSDFSGRVLREGVVKLVEAQLAGATVEYRGTYAEDAANQAKSPRGIADPLPLPRPDARKRVLLLSAAVAALLAVAIVLGMQTVSWSARWFRGHFWIPRLEFLGLTPLPKEDLDEVDPRLIPGALPKACFYPLLLMSMASTAVLIYLAVKALSPWLHLIIFPTGVLLGGIALKRLMNSRVRQWSQEVRWWPPAVFAFTQWAVAAAGVFSAMMI